MTFAELKIISQEFRRKSSALLNSDSDSADANITRFKRFIDATPIIAQIIISATDNVDYDFRKCFPTERSGGWAEIDIPFDEAEHVKAQYDYLTFIVEEAHSSVLGQAMMYYHASRKFDDMIEEFLRMAFQPLVVFIIGKLTEEMIALDKSPTMPTIQNNIGTVNGTIAQGNTVDVHNTTNVGADTTALLTLLNAAKDAINNSTLADEAKVDVLDDIDTIQEQMSISEPKKPRITKALNGINRFAKEFAMKLGVSVAASAVVGYDWNTLIQQVEAFFHI